uniref:Phage integrase family protein n=1 Tax=Leptospirillum ferrodiazotrophum TaxID=412449 RepID=C6HU02_9BACT|nr:MAG: phage integrase family protein [Leptospirillum ferrodiazotrophum]
MATITKRGDLQWQVKIRRKGFTLQSRTFNSKAESETWARLVEGEMDRGVFVDRSESEKTTVAEAFDRYEREVAVLKKGYAQEKYKISYWRKSSFGQRYIANIRPTDLAAWRDEYLKTHSPSTVNRLLIVLSHLFTIAIKEWGMGNLVNPVQQIRKPRFPRGRDRRLLPGEENVLLSACKAYGGDLSLLVRFALETGMRRSEIAGMTWQMVDLKKRTVTLLVTKNGDKRIVPLSPEAVRILSTLPRRLDDQVWEGKPGSITQAFMRVVTRARGAYEKECEKKGAKPDPTFLLDLTFHDLRHEATSRFFEKGLNPMQVAAITGHKTLQMLKRYTHLKAEDLAELLK